MAHFAKFISFLMLVSGVILLTHCGDSNGRATSGPGSTSGSPGSGGSGSGGSVSGGSGSGGSVSGGGSGSQGPSGGQSVPGFGAGTGASAQTSPAKFLYANPLPVGGPLALTIQPGGKLSAAASGSSDVQNPLGMAIDPSGSFIFQTAQGNNTAQGGGTQGGIFVYRINRSNGGLSPAIGSYLPGQAIYADVVDNLGMFLYAFGSSGVNAFRIQSGTGVLTPVPGSPFQAASLTSAEFPLSAALMAVDQTNRFLYVSTSLGIFAYTIDQTTGGLTAIAGSPFGADVVNPWAIVITPTNSYLYEVEQSDSSKIFGYSIDQTAGVLTPLLGSPFSAGNCTSMPNAAAIGSEPADNMTIPSSGKFMYDNCGVYSIDESNGAIAQVASGGPGIFPVADPTGDFVWAITGDMPACFHCDVGVAAFQIDPSTGKLTEVPNSFFLLTNSFSGDLGSLAITK